MKNVITDSSSTQNAITNLQNANSGVTNQKNIALQLEYNEDIYNLQQESIDSSRKYNAINLGLNLVSIGLDTAQKIYGIVNESQTNAADNQVSFQLEEGQRILQQSIASGATYYGTNPATGQTELVIAPEVEEWYSNAREQISQSKYMDSVKSNALNSLDISYENLKTSANGSVIEKYYSDLNTNFATKLDTLKQIDVQTYVQSGGDIDAWNANNTIQGVYAINSRSDWNSTAKQNQTLSYLQSVRESGDKEIAIGLAKSKGLKSATDYIDSRGYYSEEEKEKITTSAISAVSRAQAVAKESGIGYMEDALVNSTATPEAVYTLLDNEYSKYSDTIQRSAKEAAKQKQTELVETMVSNQLSSDKQSGIAYVYDSYNEITNGSWDAYFYDIDEVKYSAIEQYKKEIENYETTIAEQTATSIKKIDDNNKNAFSQYQTMQKLNLQKFDSGIINGETYINNEINNAKSFASAIKEGGETSSDVWTDKITLQATEAIRKIGDNYIPTQYKSALDDGIDYIKVALGYNVSNTNMTAETKEKIYDMNLEFAGHIADYIFENGAKFNEEDFHNYVIKEAQNYVLLSQNETYSNIKKGSMIFDETTMKGKIKDFKTTISYAYNTPNSGDYLAPLSSNALTGEQSYDFANDDVRATFNDMATIAKTQIQMVTGIDEQNMTIVLDNSEEGKTIFAPLVLVNDGSGRAFRFQGNGKIQMSTNGGEWQNTGLEMSTSYEGMEKQKDKNTDWIGVVGSAEFTKLFEKYNDSKGKEVATYIYDTKNVDIDNFTDWLYKHSEEPKDLDEYIERFDYAHSVGEFLPSLQDNYKEFINSAVYAVKKKKKKYKR